MKSPTDFVYLMLLPQHVQLGLKKEGNIFKKFSSISTFMTKIGTFAYRNLVADLPYKNGLDATLDPSIQVTVGALWVGRSE